MAYEINISGVVQGVGFRPHIYRRAVLAGLAGWVTNVPAGVTIFLELSEVEIDQAIKDLLTELPPAAKIATVSKITVRSEGLSDFKIIQSRQSGQRTAEISPDMATCSSCLSELSDPSNRRFLYPYINCTNCGPRYSVVLGLPYGRQKTTMATWPMCPTCNEEYQNPLNRRFHAEPIACWTCGPIYRLYARAANEPARFEEIPVAPKVVPEHAAAALRDGKIVAIKGIGGYHLACDASNQNAVIELRHRKFRKDKPFALMAKDLESVKSIANVTDDEACLLSGAESPIVLLRSRAALGAIAPDNDRVGVMLAYTPFQHLLFHFQAPRLLVMTSGNRSSEPILFKDEEALANFAGLADMVCVGERPISRRLDDSVVAVSPVSRVSFYRRSRGYAPGFVTRLPSDRPILGFGADLKSTVTLLVDGKALVSPFLGDLEYLAVQDSHRIAIDDLTSLYGIDAKTLTLARDLHPDYHSTKLAESYAIASGGIPVRAIQHHRAHIASALAEAALFGDRVVGVAMDGTGYGDDATIWGGEIFLGSLIDGFDRVAHLEPARLLGGEAANKRPLQALAGYLKCDESWADLPRLLPEKSLDSYEKITRLRSSRLSAISTTSAGRLFDAMAAVCGFGDAMTTFEGQAAIWLETLANRALAGHGRKDLRLAGIAYENTGIIRHSEALGEAITLRLGGVDGSEIALAFHASLAKAISDAVVSICHQYSVETAALSGGVFQNRLLLSQVIEHLTRAQIRVVINRDVSCNDEGISLGQVAITALCQHQ